jgi:DNA-binding transcriptional LysR family regulator
VDVDLSDRIVDFADEGLDVAVRIGTIPDCPRDRQEDLRHPIRNLCLARVPSPPRTPRKPEDLANHRCLPYFLPPLNRYREWPSRIAA